MPLHLLAPPLVFGETRLRRPLRDSALARIASMVTEAAVALAAATLTLTCLRVLTGARVHVTTCSGDKLWVCRLLGLRSGMAVEFARFLVSRMIWRSIVLFASSSWSVARCGQSRL